MQENPEDDALLARIRHSTPATYPAGDATLMLLNRPAIGEQMHLAMSSYSDIDFDDMDYPDEGLMSFLTMNGTQYAENVSPKPFTSEVRFEGPMIESNSVYRLLAKEVGVGSAALRSYLLRNNIELHTRSAPRHAPNSLNRIIMSGPLSVPKLFDIPEGASPLPPSLERHGSLVDGLSTSLRSHIFLVNAIARQVAGRPLIGTMVVGPHGRLPELEPVASHYDELIVGVDPVREVIFLSPPPVAVREDVQGEEAVPYDEATAIPSLPLPDILKRLDQEQLYEPRTLLFDDIGGTWHAKRELDAVVMSFKQEEIMLQWGADRPQGILLYGPEGTGKSMLAEALANEIEADFVEIRSTDIIDGIIGRAEKNIEKIFSRAIHSGDRTVIVFNNIDSMLTSGNPEYNRSVRGAFQEQLERIHEDDTQIIVIATTHEQDDIHPSLLESGRFDLSVSVPRPTYDERREIVTLLLAQNVRNLEDDGFRPFGPVDVSAVTAATPDFTGGRIREVFRRTIMRHAVEHAKTKVGRPITTDDLLQTVRDTNRS